MLTIRDVQFEPFRQRALTRFVDGMVAQVAGDFPAAHRELKDAGVRSLVTRVIAWSAARGVVTEGGVAALVALTIQYGDDLARSPDRAWALGVLGEAATPEGERIDRVLGRMAGRARGLVVVMAPEG